MRSIAAEELCAWLDEQTEGLMADYRADIGRHLTRINEALTNLVENADLLLEEVVVDGELTVPGSAAKLASRLKSLGEGLDMPEVINYSAVQQLLDALEEVLRGTTMAGRRYVPRLPRAHKKVIKELDYHIRTISQGHRKIKKIAEKNRTPKELEQVYVDAKELEEKMRQLTTSLDQLATLKEQLDETAGRVAKHRGTIEQFQEESGLAEIDTIRTEIDALRMLVTNQLNFLKKPFKKLSQAAGHSVMISSTAGEGADAYSADPWQAFQQDSETLARLKAGLTALVDTMEAGQLKFKSGVTRKITDRKQNVVDQEGLDERRQRLTQLTTRRQQLQSSISVDEQRQLEQSLERSKWEHRDVKAEISRNEEAIERAATRLKSLKAKVERALKRLFRDEILVQFPNEIESALAGN